MGTVMNRKPLLVVVANTLLLSIAFARSDSGFSCQANRGENQPYSTTTDAGPMFGGTPHRNLVIPRENNLPTT